MADKVAKLKEKQATQRNKLKQKQKQQRQKLQQQDETKQAKAVEKTVQSQRKLDEKLNKEQANYEQKVAQDRVKLNKRLEKMQRASNQQIEKTRVKYEQKLAKVELQSPPKAAKLQVKYERNLARMMERPPEKAEKAQDAFDQKVYKHKANAIQAITQKYIPNHYDTVEKAGQFQKQNGGWPVAIKHLNRANNYMQDLPPILRPLVVIVAFIMFRNAVERREEERDLEEARRFLRYRSRLRLWSSHFRWATTKEFQKCGRENAPNYFASELKISRSNQRRLDAR